MGCNLVLGASFKISFKHLIPSRPVKNVASHQPPVGTTSRISTGPSLGHTEKQILNLLKPHAIGCVNKKQVSL